VSAKGLLRVTVAGTGMAIVLAGGALAAAALPHAGKVYDNGTLGKHPATLVLVINPSAATKIEAGKPVFSDIASSGGYLKCPGVKRFSTSTAEVEFPFPGATLKLSGGKYAFSVSETKTNPTFLGSTEKGTLKVKITGTITSATRITGTVSASGDGCTTTAPVGYQLAYDSRAKA
jgi:hypothetical protein